MSKKSKREQQQKWLRTSFPGVTNWLLVVTPKSQLDRSFDLRTLDSGVMEDAVRPLQQQMNEFTDFDNQEDVPDQMRTPGISLFDVESKSSQIWSKLRRNVRHVHLTEGCVCGSMINVNRTRTHAAISAVAAVAAAEQQPEGLALCP